MEALVSSPAFDCPVDVTKFVMGSSYIYNQGPYITAKAKLLCQQSIWLLQLRDYPYYENFKNAGLEYLSNFYQSPTKCFTCFELASIGKTVTQLQYSNNLPIVFIVYSHDTGVKRSKFFLADEVVMHWCIHDQAHSLSREKTLSETE